MKKPKRSDVRRENRVSVDLPVSFCTDDRNRLAFEGRVQDISIEGMRLQLPLSPECVVNESLDFHLELPSPFKSIKGHGSIQWKRWNAREGFTTCGLKLEPMGLNQLCDIDLIVSEIQEDLKKTAR